MCGSRVTGTTKAAETLVSGNPQMLGACRPVLALMPLPMLLPCGAAPLPPIAIPALKPCRHGTARESNYAWRSSMCGHFQLRYVDCCKCFGAKRDEDANDKTSAGQSGSEQTGDGHLGVRAAHHVGARGTPGHGARPGGHPRWRGSCRHHACSAGHEAA